MFLILSKSLLPNCQGLPRIYHQQHSTEVKIGSINYTIISKYVAKYVGILLKCDIRSMFDSSSNPTEYPLYSIPHQQVLNAFSDVYIKTFDVLHWFDGC